MTKQTELVDRGSVFQVHGCENHNMLNYRIRRYAVIPC